MWIDAVPQGLVELAVEVLLCEVRALPPTVACVWFVVVVVVVVVMVGHVASQMVSTETEVASQKIERVCKAWPS